MNNGKDLCEAHTTKFDNFVVYTDVAQSIVSVQSIYNHYMFPKLHVLL